MQTITNLEEIQSISASLKREGRTIAHVPTMGSLHPGHISLIDEAHELADVCIVSIFVNPIQFGPNDDFLNYPSDLDMDLEICKAHGVDFVLLPQTNAMYPADFSTYVEETKISTKLAGLSRPQLFKGFATVISIFLNVLNPDYLILGQKDIHQTAIVKKVVEDLHYNIEIKVLPVVRNDLGLAWSATNHYLEGAQLEAAPKLYAALSVAKEMVKKGVVSADRIIAEVTHELGKSLKIRIAYISLINPDTLDPVDKVIPGESVLVASVWIDQVRLNDNIVL